MRPPEIVLLGGPHSGKTHYAGQLYGRLQRRPGLLGLRRDQGTPMDLSALEEVLHCLEDGRAATHTATGTWAEVALPLVDEKGRCIDLRWPDYGGEQIKTVLEQRAVSEAWRARLVVADGWLLLLRLQSGTTYPDALKQLKRQPTDRPSDLVRSKTWDTAAQTVELLQILLHTAGLGTVQRLRRPRLAVLLSCYDELEAGGSAPCDVLKEKRPLLSSFIKSNWAPEACSIWGLSSLGRLLEQDSQDDDFRNVGPEFQGWVVRPEGGAPDWDLSRPLAWLLEC